MLSDLPDGIFSSHRIYSPLVTANAELGLRRRGFPLCETSLLYCRASDSMCRPRFFRRWAFGPFDERRKQINWDRQNGRGVMLARNFLRRLQETQLQGDRLRGSWGCLDKEFVYSPGNVAPRNFSNRP
jgi:hypothetical protein